MCTHTCTCIHTHTSTPSIHLTSTHKPPLHTSPHHPLAGVFDPERFREDGHAVADGDRDVAEDSLRVYSQAVSEGCESIEWSRAY